MIVLNDSQGALDYVWEFVITPSCTGSVTHPYGTWSNWQARMDTARGYSRCYAKCAIGFGGALGFTTTPTLINSLTMTVEGYRLRDSRVTGFPPGDFTYRVQIAGFGIAYDVTRRMSTTVASKCLPDTITFRVEMDDAQLTGDCTNYRLQFSALRVYENGTLRGSLGAYDETYAPDARKLHVFMEPRVTSDFIDPTVYSGPYQDKTLPSTGPFSISGSESGPNPGNNGNHFVSSDHPIRAGYIGSSRVGPMYLPPGMPFPGFTGPDVHQTLVKIAEDWEYKVVIRGSWTHSGTTYPDVQWDMPDIIEDACTEECLGYPTPLFHSDHDVEVKAELLVESPAFTTGDVVVDGTTFRSVSGINYTTDKGYYKITNTCNYQEVTCLLVDKNNPMLSRTAYQVVRCLPNTGPRLLTTIIDDTADDAISVGDVFVVKSEFIESAWFNHPNNDLRPVPVTPHGNVRKSNESSVNTCWPAIPRCPESGTGDQMGLTYWMGSYYEAVATTTGLRVKMSTIVADIHTTDLATGSSTTSPGLTVNLQGHVTLVYHRSGTIYRRTSEDFGRNWTSAASLASGSMVTVTTDRINDIEYHAVRNSTTWKLYRKRPQDTSPVFITDIVTGVSSDSAGGITWVDSSETPLVFVYVSSGTRYRKISTDFGATWAIA